MKIHVIAKLIRLPLFACCAMLASSACRTLSSDLVITHVRLIDGTGGEARNASVRIRDGRILEVGELSPSSRDTVVDGQGMVLAPGFIDAHSHHLGYLGRDPDALATASQGITTIVIGQDGSSEPMDSLQALFERGGFAVNIAGYTGQTTLREQAMGPDSLLRPARPEEVAAMQKLLRKELEKGSLGLSTGLEYEGAFYSTREEVLDLAKTTAQAGGRYISHIRSEDLHLDEALDEIIDIGRATGMPVQISHIKIADRERWGKAGEVIARLEKARREGVDITADIYPYTFWNSTLKVLFPDKRYDDLCSAQLAVDRLFDPDSSMLARFRPDTAYEGRMLGDIARSRGETPAKTLLALVGAAKDYRARHPDADGVEAIAGKSMHEADVRTFTRWPHTVICSDGNGGRHPRGFGTFPRVLGRYVREAGILTLPEAIHKMTGLTTRQLGIPDRGLIRPGYPADLVLLDPDTVIDNATLADGNAPSTGILRVWVNGRMVFDKGKPTGLRPGRLVTRNDPKTKDTP
jgi:N-acyl-D-aspartate/D-glutamate deacylase